MTSLPRLSLVVVNPNDTKTVHDLRVSECQGKFEASILGTKSQTIQLKGVLGPEGKRIEAAIGIVTMMQTMNLSSSIRRPNSQSP